MTTGYENFTDRVAITLAHLRVLRMSKSWKATLSTWSDDDVLDLMNSYYTPAFQVKELLDREEPPPYRDLQTIP